MATRTPGNWRADGISVVDERGAVIAVCRQAKPRNTMEARENAGAIAAMPDLLESCIGLMALIQSSTCPARQLIDSRIFRGAAEAIAKAEGMPCVSRTQ